MPQIGIYVILNLVFETDFSGIPKTAEWVDRYDETIGWFIGDSFLGALCMKIQWLVIECKCYARNRYEAKSSLKSRILISDSINFTIFFSILDFKNQW